MASPAERALFYQNWVQPLIAEFWGQLIFAFLHCSTAHTIGLVQGGGYHNPLLPAINDGLTVAVMVILIGHIRSVCGYANVNLAADKIKKKKENLHMKKENLQIFCE